MFQTLQTFVEELRKLCYHSNHYVGYGDFPVLHKHPSVEKQDIVCVLLYTFVAFVVLCRSPAVVLLFPAKSSKVVSNKAFKCHNTSSPDGQNLFEDYEKQNFSKKM